MPKIKRLRHGIGAKISVYKKFLHPRALLAARYPNAEKTDVLHGLVAVRQEEKTVSKKRQSCIVMRHNDFDDGDLLHAVTRYCKVVEEGAVEHLFNETLGDSVDGGGPVAVEEQANEAIEIPSISYDEDASKFRALGFCVDDDNDPAPENIPSPTENPDGCVYKQWNSVPYCDGRLCGANNVQPTLIRADQTLHTVLGFFIHFLPVAYFKTTMIPATNVFFLIRCRGRNSSAFWASSS